MNTTKHHDHDHEAIDRALIVLFYRLVGKFLIFFQDLPDVDVDPRVVQICNHRALWSSWRCIHKLFGKAMVYNTRYAVHKEPRFSTHDYHIPAANKKCDWLDIFGLAAY